MNDQLSLDLKQIVKGEVYTDPTTLTKYSHDASIFELTPSCVVSPVDGNDIEKIVDYVNLHKNEHRELSITARSAGTDMSGGALSESIVLSLTEHLNKTLEVGDNFAVVEPGAFYRDFEKLTLQKNLIFPAYPSSREICAIGGMIGNNCGGEKSLEDGKAEKYVESLKVVLADGHTYTFSKLTESELQEKLKLTSFEGEIYRKIYKLISDNYDALSLAKPKVSKNSAGYFLWNVYDKTANTFDLTKLFVGSQGTLGIITEAKLKLIPALKHSEMLLVHMNERDMANLGEIIKTVVTFNPESFEAYDDNTLKLALKYFPEFAPKLGTGNIISTALAFLPEFLLSIQGKLPKLMLQIEFTGDDLTILKSKVRELDAALAKFKLVTKSAGDETQSKKYWLMRRESFKLLKEKIKDKYASPFIDDIVVNPEYLTEFLPKLTALIAQYPSIISTTAGHIGDGNFHIIPLVNLKEESERKIIQELGAKVYELVFSYHGTTNGEHNDGLIRTPYLKAMYGEAIMELFTQTKNIFDPKNIFNPGKKVNVTMDYAMSHIRQTW